MALGRTIAIVGVLIVIGRVAAAQTTLSPSAVYKRGVAGNGLPCLSVETGRIPSAERKHWR